MAVVRENLDLFDRMRVEDPALTWADIAVSLGKQGVLQRDGQPITAKRLAALISTIRKQRVSKAQAADRRATRDDVASGRHRVARSGARERRLTLAPELSQAAAKPAQADEQGEEMIRAERYAQHDKLFKRKE